MKNITIDIFSANTDTCTRRGQKEQLETMFPTANSTAITQAIERSGSVHEVIDILLSAKFEEKVLKSIFNQSMIECCMYRSLGPLLHCSDNRW